MGMEVVVMEQKKDRDRDTKNARERGDEKILRLLEELKGLAESTARKVEVLYNETPSWHDRDE